jgi:diguanylate cyclase
MTSPNNPNIEHRLFHALIDLLDIPEREKVRKTLDNFRELTRTLDPRASPKLVNIKLQGLLKIRDEALIEARSGDKSQFEKVHEPVQEILERALDLLENATSTSGGFSGALKEAILELRKAKDIVSLNKLSEHLIHTSNGMMEATNKFQDNIGELAEKVNGYQDRIEQLEYQLEQQKELTYTDALTKVENRGSFERRFKMVFIRSIRERQSLCMCFLDVDRFKEINDTYGHQAGDDVLMNLAQLMKRTVAGKGTVFRFGGDEFAILFENVALEEAAGLVENIKGYVEGNTYHFQEHAFNLSISGGLTARQDDDDRGSFIKRADALLYRAKKQGRKQICVG